MTGRGNSHNHNWNVGYGYLLFKDGATIKEIAKRYKLHVNTVSRAAKKYNWHERKKRETNVERGVSEQAIRKVREEVRAKQVTVYDQMMIAVEECILTTMAVASNSAKVLAMAQGKVAKESRRLRDAGVEYGDEWEKVVERQCRIVRSTKEVSQVIRSIIPETSEGLAERMALQQQRIIEIIDREEYKENDGSDSKAS